MQTMTINIINPKAEKLIQNLVDLDLISIEESQKGNRLTNILEKLRANENEAPSIGEITEEVELVRAKRFANGKA